MKKFAIFVISGIVFCLLAGTVVSCSEEDDCSMTTNRGMINCILYTIDSETSVISTYTLDSLTVTAYGTDSVIINNQKEVEDISIPLRYTVDSTQLVFRYSRNTTDTLIIRHTNTPYFVSMDCGYQMQQTITGIGYTRHRLDSIYISDNEAGIYGSENIRLFY